MPGAILIREASLGSTGRGGRSSSPAAATTPEALLGAIAPALPDVAPIGALPPFKIAAAAALLPATTAPDGTAAAAPAARFGVLPATPVGAGAPVVAEVAGRGVGTPVAMVVGTGA